MLRVRPQRAVEEIARADCVDLDAVLDQLQRERLRQADAAELAAGVRPVAVRARQPRLGIDLDDVARVRRKGFVLDRQDGSRVLHAPEIALVVDVRDEIEFLLRLRLDGARGQHAGVRDEDVKASIHPDDPVNAFRNGRHARDVHDQSHGSSSAKPVADLSGGALDALSVDVRQGHVSALGGEALRDFQSEPLRCARDHRHLPGRASDGA